VIHTLHVRRGRWASAIWWLAAETLAAPSDARFRRIGPDDGLAHGHVISILQDRQGFIWFATELGGLDRYDGLEHRVYHYDPGDPGSLSHDFVWTLYEDRAGVLWVGTNGGGLDRYDRAKDAFVRYRHDPRDEGSLPHDNVKAIYEDAAGTFWIGTDGGLSRLDRATGRFTTYRDGSGEAAGLEDASVRSIVEDPVGGGLWLGTRRGGAVVLDRATGRFTHHRHRPDDPRSVANDTVTRIVVDRAGELWLATYGGLDRFDRQTGGFHHHRHDPRRPDGLASDTLRALHEDRQGRLWIGTSAGLDLFDRARGIFEHHRLDPHDPESLGDDDVWCLAEDDVGALWVGGANAGASRLSPAPRRFTVLRPRPTDDRGLSGEAVQAVHVDRAGVLWVGTKEGLDRVDRGRLTRYRQREAEPRRLGSDDVRAIVEDAAGVLWVGTAGGGLAGLDARGLTRYPNDPEDPESLAGPDIDALHAGADGRLWIAVHGVGLDAFDGRRFTHYGPSLPAPHTLPTHYVLDILEHPRGVLWLATNAQGLLRLAPGTGAVEAYPIDPDHPTSESANRIHVLHLDAGGTLWVGADAGLLRFDPQARRYTEHFTPRDGLPGRAVVGIEADEAGRLWLATAHGLSRFDPEAKRFRNYDRADGLPGDAFVWRAHAHGGDGRLYFGGSRGLAVFDPSLLRDNTHRPPVVLTGFELFDRPVAVGGPGSPLREAIAVAREITLRHAQSSFTLRFAALDYEAPPRNRYRYRMEGFDGEWRTTGAGDHSATYTNLDPGHYVFHVRGANNDGVWNETGASLVVVVQPPWWGTWWFRGLLAAALAGLVVAGHRVRVRTLAERERRFRTLAENAPDVVVRYDRRRRYVYANPAIEEYTGQPPAAFLGKTHRDLALAAAHVERWDAALDDVFATGRPATLEFDFRTPKGMRSFEARLVPERGADGGTSSVLVITRDVTGHKVLLREIHHRVKNNLQVVSSLLSLQSHHVHDEEARAVLNDSRSRVTSMALIHEKLFQSANLARVDAREYVRSLVAALFASYGVNRDRLRVAVEVDDVTLGIDTAVPCGLLINELVSNALKHAFPDPLPGTIEVGLRAEGEGRFRLRVADDGIGMPAGLDVGHPETLGLELVSALVAQLDGTLEVTRGPGTAFEVRFAEMRYRDRL
jgi:PAS domain S-box-containing protein